MSEFLPSVRALQIFSAVARHQSLSHAAEDLCITHSAVSQQLSKLEQQLGVKLLGRSSRGVTLTDAGQIYRRRVDDDLTRLKAHMIEVMSLRQGETSLIVGVVPVLAERWLLPRLQTFVALHRRVSISVREFPNKVYVYEPPFDVALHYEDAIWPGTHREPLMMESCVAVCGPNATFVQRFIKGDFSKIPLLHLTNRPQAWQRWFADASSVHAPPNPLVGHRFDLFSTLAEAVRSGLGVGLVPTFFAERDLDKGELLAHRHVQQGTQAYATFATHQCVGNPAALAFLSWLRSE